MWKKRNYRKLQQNKGWMVLVLLCVLGICGCSTKDRGSSLDQVLVLDRDAGAQDSVQREECSPADEKASVVYVHVCGAVADPGVVEVPKGSRVLAAVEAAGGFLPEADSTYVNLAALLSDGEQVYIPTKEEAIHMKSGQDMQQKGLINLNTADVTLLCTLPGIGESRAGDIILYRQEHGGFESVEEIKKVSGIKDSIYNKIKDRITVE